MCHVRVSAVGTVGSCGLWAVAPRSKIDAMTRFYVHWRVALKVA